MAGVYETYDGAVVTLLDDHHDRCTEPAHVEGQQVPELAGMTRDDADRLSGRHREH